MWYPEETAGTSKTSKATSNATKPNPGKPKNSEDVKGKVKAKEPLPKVEKKRAESPQLETIDVTKPDKQNTEPAFFVEDDRKSKITVVSLKTNRTARTSNTIPSIVEPRKKRKTGAFNKVKDGFRESSIKRIVASGFVVATFLLLLFGVFLPFWNVYTSTVNDVSTGYYGGLWNLCTVTSGVTSCNTYVEADVEAWLRAVRFFELVAFMGVLGWMGLTAAYMFLLREKSYSYLQWIIIGLSAGIALFIFLGLIVYGASYPTPSHISSAYGLTWCAFFCCLASGALFLWDKLIQRNKNPEPAPRPTPVGTPRPGPPSSVKSYRSFAQSSRLGGAASTRSKMTTPRKF